MKCIKVIQLTTIIVSVTLLSSCATPYQAQGLMGGYKDMQLNKDTYFIAFRGNGWTRATTVQRYVLRRAAELTLNHGDQYFLVLDGGTNTKSEMMSTPTTIQSQSTGNFEGTNYGGYNTSGFGSSSTYTTINPGSEYNINKYQAKLVIKMLHSNILITSLA